MYKPAVSENFKEATNHTEDSTNSRTTFNKKRRTRFTPEQTARLENEFRQTDKPSEEKIQELSALFTLPEKKVKTWFLNRRTKEKKKFAAPNHVSLPGMGPLQHFNGNSNRENSSISFSSNGGNSGERFVSSLVQNSSIQFKTSLVTVVQPQEQYLSTQGHSATPFMPPEESFSFQNWNNNSVTPNASTNQNNYGVRNHYANDNNANTIINQQLYGMQQNYSDHQQHNWQNYPAGSYPHYNHPQNTVQNHEIFYQGNERADNFYNHTPGRSSQEYFPIQRNPVPDSYFNPAPTESSQTETNNSNVPVQVSQHNSNAFLASNSGRTES
ncbi:Homeobox protein MIXL1 [Armadillidium vulgare]|nr:Homeobox protein MIXL1 [Armadillidium vulgare]